MPSSLTIGVPDVAATLATSAMVLTACTGMFQWVVDTFPEGNPNSNAGTNTGTPPTNRYELEPNSVQFMFTKEVNTYGYPESTKDNQE